MGSFCKTLFATLVALLFVTGLMLNIWLRGVYRRPLLLKKCIQSLAFGMNVPHAMPHSPYEMRNQKRGLKNGETQAQKKCHLCSIHLCLLSPETSCSLSFSLVVMFFSPSILSCLCSVNLPLASLICKLPLAWLPALCFPGTMTMFSSDPISASSHH